MVFVWASQRYGYPHSQTPSDMGIKIKLNARLAIQIRANLFDAKIPANKIDLPLRKANFLYIRDTA